MISIENIDVYGWKAAIRGMRNPMNSWDKSDSGYQLLYEDSTICDAEYSIGENDLTLMKKLVKAGTDHSKFMRMINVTMDITAPMYWWKEFDTYKVATVRNSCSTMHKLTDKEFTIDDFSTDYLGRDDIGGSLIRCTVRDLNYLRNEYLSTKNKKYWYQIVQLLPSSYNQRSTVQMNYAVLANMYFSRKNHKLDEWVSFCKKIEDLPYMRDLLDIVDAPEE